MIRESVEKVVRCIDGAGGGAVTRMRRRARRGTQGNLRGGTSLDGAEIEEDRGRDDGESRRHEEDSWERKATRGPPHEASTTTYQSKLAWAFQWLQDDNPRRLLSLQK